MNCVQHLGITCVGPYFWSLDQGVLSSISGPPVNKSLLSGWFLTASFTSVYHGFKRTSKLAYSPFESIYKLLGLAKATPAFGWVPSLVRSRHSFLAGPLRHMCNALVERSRLGILRRRASYVLIRKATKNDNSTYLALSIIISD